MNFTSSCKQTSWEATEQRLISRCMNLYLLTLKYFLHYLGNVFGGVYVHVVNKNFFRRVVDLLSACFRHVHLQTLV